MPYEVERYHDFSAGHRVCGHESKCAMLHGHNYRVYFVCAPEGSVFTAFATGDELVGALDTVGRVIDFGEIKTRLCGWLETMWDHRFLLWEEDPLGDILAAADPDGVVFVPFNPTAENMARYLVDVVGPMELEGTGVRLVSCRVEETRKCSATYHRSDA
jgi:6-pyruvoyltetrahydropterin/6-carboxytetrahydropterin synthase